MQKTNKTTEKRPRKEIHIDGYETQTSKDINVCNEQEQETVIQMPTGVKEGSHACVDCAI